METGFVNSLDGDLSVLSHFYDQGMLEDTESLLEIMQDDFSFASLSSSQLIGSSGLWDQDTNDSADAGMAVPFAVDSSQPDFQKMFADWQEHLGTMQGDDSEEMDVKDLAELDIDMPKNVPVDIPSDIFENSHCELKTDLSVGKSSSSSRDRIFSELSMNLNENLSTFNLENFLEDDDEEEHKFGLIVAEEEELADKTNLYSITKGPEIAASNAGVGSSDNVSSAEKGTAKAEAEEEAVDVETVLDHIPVLEAGDVHSLLEQFEASEAFNRDRPLPPAKPAKAAVSEPAKKRVAQASNASSTPSPTPTSTSSTSVSPSVEASRITLHETIRDSLPQEVIDRIKASNRRKPISVIPAMPSRRPGRGATRMQVAAATLSRNKLLKLVSGGGKSGESIQLDHDYCSSASSPPAEVAPPKSFYHSNASEYTSEQSQSSPGSSKDSEDSSCAKSVLGDNKVYSRLPEYYVVLAPQKALERGRKGAIKEEMWDKNSRKDSGLESGEVSDASEETVGTPMTVGSREIVSTSSPSLVKSEDRKCIKNIVPSSTEKGVVTVDVQNKVDLSDRRKPGGVIRAEGSQCVLKDWSTLRQDGKSKPVAMVSVLKKNNVGCVTNMAGRQQSLLISSNCNITSNSSSSSSNNSSTSCKNLIEAGNIKSEGPKKRKLNLEEYRSRLKELDRTKIKEEPSMSKSVSVLMSASNLVTAKVGGVPVEPSKEDNKEATAGISAAAVAVATAAEEEEEEEEEKAQRPVMHSVEVQTQTSIFNEVPDIAGKAQERRSRKKQRKYCSTRASSSSSSHSTSSSGSRRHRRSRSQIRRRTSRRRSNGGHSVSSSGSQHPRSRSNSSPSSSYSSYSSRSRSRSRSHSSARHSPSSCRPRSSHPYQHRYGSRRPLPYSTGWRSRSRSPSYANRKNDWMISEREKQRQVEERRVIYVGRIDEGTSKAELRRRFEPFGPIVDISVHFREHGDNYGFVTFAYKVDAYEAVEHGNDDPNLPRYDLCFGGRRAFCKTRYADLDGLATSDGTASGYIRSSGFSRRTEPPAEDFDLLLREAQAKMRKRKV